jgi:integrase
MSDRIPTYRKKTTATGIYAVVTLSDGPGKRRDVILGQYGTAQSRAEYRRVLGEWEANGRRLHKQGGKDLTVNEIAAAYWRFAKKCRPARPGASHGEIHCLRSALKPLKDLYGHIVVEKFGPLALKTVRERMIQTKAPCGRPWSRSFVNRGIGRIKRMFKWAVENEMISPVSLHALQTVRGLMRGQSEARETDPVRPVPVAYVEAVIPHVPRPVAAMIQLQLLTAMRPGEVVIMRGIDLNMSGKIWFYTPEYYKTQWRGHLRAIAIGPQGQAIIREFLTTDTQAYLFSPRQFIEERRQTLRLHRKSKVQPSQVNRRKKNPKRQAGELYDVAAYRTAIRRGCLKADAAAHKERPEVPADQRIIPDWAPNQLRHTRATELRKEFGLDAARCILGHRSPQITEVYAELDASAAEKIMSAIG